MLVSVCLAGIVHIAALLFCIGCAIWVVFYEFEWKICTVIFVSFFDIVIRVSIGVRLYTIRAANLKSSTPFRSPRPSDFETSTTTAPFV